MHNPNKVNQDAYITHPHVMGLRHCHFFSVCDGHGSNGREVSGLLKQRLAPHIEEQVSKNLAEHDLLQYPEHPPIKEAFLDGFELMSSELKGSGIDVRFSGSTCVSLLTYGRQIFMGNVGDSRAIVVKEDPLDPN